jgi:hypothetical protein
VPVFLWGDRPCFAPTPASARATPPEVLGLMTRAAFALMKRGYVLRSGHAIGADSAFERGAGSAAQIFLPVPGWRGSASSFHVGILGAQLWGRAREIAAAHHPAFAGLSHFVQDLHTRNVFQVLGPTLDSPSEFVGRHRPGAVLHGTRRRRW